MLRGLATLWEDSLPYLPHQSPWRSVSSALGFAACGQCHPGRAASGPTALLEGWSEGVQRPGTSYTPKKCPLAVVHFPVLGSQVDMERRAGLVAQAALGSLKHPQVTSSLSPQVQVGPPAGSEREADLHWVCRTSWPLHLKRSPRQASSCRHSEGTVPPRPRALRSLGERLVCGSVLWIKNQWSM